MTSLKKLVMTLGLMALGNMAAWAEPKVSYVGLGRYTCSGTAAECAPIYTNNDRQEEASRRRYQEEQERAKRYVEESRRREREARPDRQYD